MHYCFSSGKEEKRRLEYTLTYGLIRRLKLAPPFLLCKWFSYPVDCFIYGLTIQIKSWTVTDPLNGSFYRQLPFVFSTEWFEIVQHSACFDGCVMVSTFGGDALYWAPYTHTHTHTYTHTSWAGEHTGFHCVAGVCGTCDSIAQQACVMGGLSQSQTAWDPLTGAWSYQVC